METNSSTIKLFISLMIAVMAFGLAACPHQLVGQLENMEARRDSLKLQRQVYVTRSQNFDSPATISKTYFSDSTMNYDSLAKTPVFPIRFQITKVGSDSFPGKIVLNAVVFDTAGKYVGGLAPPFTKIENFKYFWPSLIDSCAGVAHNITEYTVEEVRNNKNQPFAIYFVLDHSGSMGSNAFILQQAVQKVLYAIKKQDYVGVIKFAGNQVEEVPLTNDAKEYRSKFQTNGLRDSRLSGGTAIYSSVAAAITCLDKAPAGAKKVIILFSDGMDTESKVSFDSAAVMARQRKVEVHTIAYKLADKTMPEFAAATGGRFYPIFSTDEFLFAFRDIYLLLNNYYRIVYDPPDCLSRHDVTLGLSLMPKKMKEIIATADYDKSVFNRYDPVGSMVTADIEFDFGKSIVRPESMKYIVQVADAMKANPNMKVRVNGHTDDIGSVEANQKLSVERAEAVKNALVELGIAEDRLFARGFGESKPAAPNDSEENRRKNRRTEFEVIAK